ncbi:MAG TPA: tyrosine--tRNA ligase [Thermoanaerobaculia bacterium]|jgi:tyrosyl-tRNA synthetase|nr:tyrosine--tRNA ligase [Thermoanaerobaculia bacterium]
MSGHFPPVEEQLALLRRGAVDLVEEDQLRAKLERSRASGKPLVVKVGFDPTAPDLHLGHTVLLRKMRHFQEMGHRVVFVMGDFTAMIGDPSGKKVTRPQLSREEVARNAETYARQVYRILDRDRTEIEFNSRWLGELGAEGMVRLAGSYTLARMLEREDFRTRLATHQPISIHELLYPLAQGYDSIALGADVELGGTDQLFNLLVGRQLMKERGLEPQVVITNPLLVGTDGTEKMSKSLGNAIAVEDAARQIYGRTMSIPDALLWDWLTLLTELSETEIADRRRRCESGELNPKAVKMELARRLAAQFHGEAAAREAEHEFETVFGGGGTPEDVPTIEVAAGQPLQAMVAAAGLAPSKSEARRLLGQGAVTIDGEKTTDPFAELPARGEPYLLKVGKRRWARLAVGPPRSPGTDP